MQTSELRARLEDLNSEMVEAASVGLTNCDAYMRDLEEEIDHCRAALMGASVTEIAVARAQLYGPLFG